MIVSHKYKFIFMRPVKVAGASVEAAMMKYLDEGDVIVHEGTCQNAEGWDKMQHEPPSKIKKFVGDDIWNEYQKITIVRNPWDVLVSLYFWGLRMREYNSPVRFKEFLRWNLFGSYPANKRCMLMNGRKWADRYMRFETLQYDVDELFDELGFEDSKMPRIHTGIRPSGLHYSCMYDLDSQRLVKMAYLSEIRAFDYQFEDLKKVWSKSEIDEIDDEEDNE